MSSTSVRPVRDGLFVEAGGEVRLVGSQCEQCGVVSAVADPEAFEPYGVGYNELAGEVRVEARLIVADPARLRIGMANEAGARSRPGDEGAVTYAFEPVEEAAP